MSQKDVAIINDYSFKLEYQNTNLSGREYLDHIHATSSKIAKKDKCCQQMLADFPAISPIDSRDRWRANISYNMNIK